VVPPQKAKHSAVQHHCTVDLPPSFCWSSPQPHLHLAASFASASFCSLASAVILPRSSLWTGIGALGWNVVPAA
jgi:hypothetical protein